NFITSDKQRLARQATQYLVEQGQLLKKNKNNFDKPLRVITLQDRERILYDLHSSPLGGHFGFKKTIEKALERYYWPTMGKDIKAYIESCDSCQRFGNPRKIQLTESIPWQQITSPNDLKHVPGAHFVNDTIKLLKEEIGFQHKLASFYHPQTNGLTERFNGTLYRSITKCLRTSQSNWDQLIPSVLFAYHTLKHESTKYTPFYLVHGKEEQLPIDVEFNDKENHSVLTYEEALERRISSLIGTFTDALIISSRNVTSTQKLQKERQKHLAKAYEYHENDIILLYDSAKRQVSQQTSLTIPTHYRRTRPQNFNRYIEDACNAEVDLDLELYDKGDILSLVSVAIDTAKTNGQRLFAYSKSWSLLSKDLVERQLTMKQLRQE
ncbi:24609_t:CDS:2, partial [Dentiscutata erythropus]